MSSQEESERMGIFIVESNESSMVSWISWYCSLPGHYYFVEVPEYSYLNLGLSQIIPLYDEALDMILDLENTSDDGIERDSNYTQQVENSAEKLYIYIHSSQGLEFMAKRCQDAEFGTCPRVYCGGCSVLPIGLHNTLGMDTVKLYCPRCNDIYEPAEQRVQQVDGAAFGPTFAPLLFQTFRELIPPLKSSTIPMPRIYDSDDSEESDREPRIVKDYGYYEMKIYGFRISPRSPFGPRMKWLRYKEG